MTLCKVAFTISVMIEKELQNKVREYRVIAGMTQDHLAEMVGVSRQTIIAIEKGDYVPSTKLALLLAHALGVDVNKLFYLSSSNSDVI